MERTQEQTRLDNKLLHAAVAGNTEEIIRLVGAGADPRAEGSIGENCMSIAAYRGSAIVWRTMRYLGCVPKTDKRGCHPETLRVKNHGSGRGATWERFVRACETGNVRDLELLLMTTNGLELGRDKHGRTGLHFAAANEQERIFEMLVDRGADPHEADRFGRTAWLELTTAKVGQILAEIKRRHGKRQDEIPEPDLIELSMEEAKKARLDFLLRYPELYR